MLRYRLTATVALGNGDGHARNHSILIEDGVVRLAPAYDIGPRRVSGTPW